jgi:hypothetical protein
MEQQKTRYTRAGWFLIAATVVGLVLAATVHAVMAVLIAIGILGVGGGIALIVLGHRG